MEASDFPQHRITIRDIAAKLGLSRAAISLGLRNSPELSEATCRRIQSTALELGYQPNLSATSLAYARHSASDKTVHAAFAWINAWRMPKELRSFQQFERYWEHARQTAAAAGFRLEEFVVDATTSVSRLQHIFVTRNIHGIIIPPHHSTSHWCRLYKGAFDWSRFSAVRIGHSVVDPAVPVVSPDQVGNCMLAVRKMTELGYERIGFVALADIRKSTQNWFLGGYFLAQIALPRQGQIPVLYLEGQQTSRNSKRFHAWLKRYKPDAILTELRDIQFRLESMGVRVPDDLGLATLNALDGKIAAGIYQNPELIGKATAEILIAMINRNERSGSPNYRTTTVMGRWQDGPTLPPRTVSAHPIYLPGRTFHTGPFSM